MKCKRVFFVAFGLALLTFLTVSPFVSVTEAVSQKPIKLSFSTMFPRAVLSPIWIYPFIHHLGSPPYNCYYSIPKREKDIIPSIATKRYPDFVRSGMDRGYKNPLAELSHSPIVGSREFVAEIKDRFLRKKQPDRDFPALRELSSTPELDYVEKAVDSVLHSEEKLARQVKLHL